MWWKAGTGLWMSLAILATFVYVGPAPLFLFPDGARSIIFHVPCAWLATLCYVVGAWYAVSYLARKTTDAVTAYSSDRKSAAAMELGLVFSILTTLTGSLFSKMEWGAYWVWDPRQTSILVICLLFAAYVVLRGALTDPEVRGRLCAVYALVALVPGLFLIWVLPRIVSFTLHVDANKAIVGGGLGGHYRPVLYGLALPAFIGLFVWIFQLRVRMMKLEAAAEEAL
jgi:heme exporter protein C